MSITNQFFAAVLVAVALFRFGPALHEGASPIAPAIGGNLKVCVVHDYLHDSELENEVVVAMQSQEIRDFINEHDGNREDGVAEYKLFDIHQNAKDMEKKWQSVIARPRKSVPWVYVDVGRSRDKGKPFKTNTKEFLAELKAKVGDDE